ncbi:hypothetical protein CY34DRAFT_723089 [Suillus luteus UH-Slu-Lm8-n1]|uniref:Uncharacterized protein n=1 Tax=Suillus luteus UH-Slu-Lm8-n1 TaxID=930992 RepID=A0A0D0A4L9_9AGAM|nr:hypothetical protein CY34DRAFT_723089 [Suillus luteus UH-Slu-Lm8-n1]
MLCYRSSNTSTQSPALRYQVKITTSINHSQCKTFLVLFVFVSESTMPVPDRLKFNVSRSLTLRLAADLDSESAYHAYNDQLFEPAILQ